MVIKNGPVQRRRALLVRLGIHVGFIGQKQFRHVLVALNRRPVQRRIAMVLLSIYIGMLGQEQFGNVLVALNRRQVQRRIAVVVFTENQIRVLFEQRLDLCQVALASRVTNLAGSHVIPSA